MTEKIKVFELAPELGLRPLELVTKLKEAGIEVKQGHMSELSGEDVDKIKAYISKPKEVKIEEKKTVVKKKAKEAPTKKEPERKVLGKIVKKETKKKEEKPLPAPEPVKTVKTIIRRKKTVEEEKAAELKLVEDAAKKVEEAKLAEAAAKQEQQAGKAKEADKTAADTKAAPAKHDDKKHFAPKHVTTRAMSHEELEREKLKEKKRGKPQKKDGKIEVVDVFELKKFNGRAYYGAKKKPQAGKEQKKTLITTPRASKRKIRITGNTITVADLAKEMSVKASEIVQKLFAMGTMATINHPLDIDTAILIANEFSYEIERTAFDENALLRPLEDKAEHIVPRSPVVTMMGHVDHGKTSILDAIRKTNVADKEAGGITQHMGAHEVELEKGFITFLDTPGHEAFTEMRARGSQVTDIVVLVVAADDGVMPQTRESIDHCRAAGVQIVVALNKIDKPNANIDMVKKQLAELELLSEDWGGQTIVVPTAAKKGEGIKQLMEAILLQAEIMEIKADPSGFGEGIVVEARLDKGMGPCATVITQRGTLKVGDYVVAGTSSGRIKSIKNSHGKMVDAVLPGRAGEILGLDTVPMAGEKFNCVANENDASRLIDHRIDQKRRQEPVDGRKNLTLEEIMQGISKGETKELKLVLKADAQGSVEALKASLENLSDETVGVKIIHASTGGVTTNDVNLAVASGAVIIAFNVRPDVKAMAEAERVKLDIKFYDVIYNCLDDMEKVKRGMLDPTAVEKVNGQAEVRQIFNISRIGTIAGCGVKSGKIIRNSMVRVIRDGVVVFTGKIKSLKRFKDDAKEVTAGVECGMSIDGFNDIKPGDIFESYSVSMIDADGAVVSTKKSAKSKSAKATPDQGQGA